MAGAAVLTAAFLPGAAASIPLGVPSVGGLPGLVVVGGVLGVGLLVVGGRLLRGKAPVPEGTLEPQEQAKSQGARERTKHPSTSPGGTTVDRSPDSARSSKPPTEEEKRMDSLEEKIKAIDRRMSQAKVKLGTGELSPEGYQKVMGELEEKRAELEKLRVDIELDQSEI